AADRILVTATAATAATTAGNRAVIDDRCRNCRIDGRAASAASTTAAAVAAVAALAAHANDVAVVGDGDLAASRPTRAGFHRRHGGHVRRDHDARRHVHLNGNSREAVPAGGYRHRLDVVVLNIRV